MPSLSYRIVARRKRLGLVAQDASLLRGMHGQLLHAEVAPGEFNTDWSQIPAHNRRAIPLIACVFGGCRYFTATKELIGKKMKSDDLASSDAVMRGDFAPGLDRAIMTSRDAALIASMDFILNQPGTRKQ